MSRYRDERDDDDPRSRARRGGYDEPRDERGGYGGRSGDARDFDQDERGRRDGSERDDATARDDYYRRTDYAGGAVGQRGERGDYDPRKRSDRYTDDPRGHGEMRGRDDERGGRDDERGASYGAGRDAFRDGSSSSSSRRGEEGRRRGATRSHVRCRDIMTRDVTVATRATTLEEVARLMKNEDTGVIPVVDREDDDLQGKSVNPVTERMRDDAPAPEETGSRRSRSTTHGNGRLVGLITDRDIVVRAIAAGRDPRTTRAEEIMTEEVHTAQPNDRVIEAIRKMGDKQVRRIPIVDQDRTLRGIISMADVALETNDDRELAEALEEISSGSSFWNRIFG